jgi:acyl-CoA thioester hydrolase
MSKLGITYRGAVHEWHCDQMGHMNVMWYMGKFDEATWNMAAMCGLDIHYLRANKRGMAAVDHRICYRRELISGDTVLVRSAVLEVKPKIVRFVHEMFRADNDEFAAALIGTAVHIDLVARKSVAFEAQVLAKSEALLEPDPGRWDVWPPKEAQLR